MSVVGLDGKPIEGAPPSNTPLAVLEGLVADIKEGRVVIDKVYIMAELPAEDDPSMVVRRSWDSGLTAAELVFWCEMHKDEVIQMVRGGKA